MSNMNIQSQNQQGFPLHHKAKSKYIPPPPFNPSHYQQNISPFKPGSVQKQYYPSPSNYNAHHQTSNPKPSQIFFEPIYKVPAPNFQEEDRKEDMNSFKETQTKQKNSYKEPVDIFVAKQENIPSLNKKGIFKIKLGAVYTKKDRIPDDFSCFIQLIQSIFPCLVPDFKQPLNKLLSKEQLKVLELQQKAIAPLINNNEKIYQIFYLDANDKPVNIKNAQDYNELNRQLVNNIHPTHGLKMFIIPIQGDNFLHRFSLGGERQVELNQQLWKLLFTDNNYITKLREEKPINKPNIDSDNISGMRDLLIGQLKESIVAANICDDDDENKKASDREQQLEEDLNPQIKRDDDDDDEDQKQRQHQLKLDEFSIVERISEVKSFKNDQEGLAKIDDVSVVAQQNCKEQHEDQIKQKQEREQKSESQSDLDEQDIRLLVRQRIDKEIRALIQQQFQNLDQDIKFYEMEDIILSKLFIKRQDSEIDSIPPISFQEVNYSQIKEADIEFIMNPFENDQEKVEGKDEEEKQQDDSYEQAQNNELALDNEQVQDKQQMKVKDQIRVEVVDQENQESDQEMKVKNQIFERKAIDTNQEKEEVIVKKSIEYPIYPQGIIIQPAYKPQIKKENNKEDEIKKPEKRQYIPPPFGMIFQAQIQHNQIKQPKNDLKSPKPYIPQYNEQAKAGPNRYPFYPPAQYIKRKQKKKGFFDRLKKSAAKFINAFKGDEKMKYRWAPMQMAAIIRHLSPQTDLIIANAERVNNQKFIALPKKLITKRVKLINLSGHKWPKDVYISKVKGDKEIILEDAKVNISLNPGEEGMIQIPLKTPKKEGLYKCIFSLKGRFSDKKKLYFGELMGVQILVKREQQQDHEQKLYEDAEILLRENLGTFEECVRSLRCNKYKIKKARKDLMLKFQK